MFLVTETQYPPLPPWKTGLNCRCPRCGEGPVLKGYLSIREDCPSCGLSYSFAEPADGPAFFVMSVVGIVGMCLFMVFEFNMHPPIWVHFVFTFPLIAAMCLAILRPFKGWMIAKQYQYKALEARF